MRSNNINSFTTGHLNQSLHNKLFFFLLLVLCWAPLPLGSNRPWAWSLLEIAFFALTVGCIFLKRKSAFLGLQKYKFAIILWLLFLVIVLFQAVPLPTSIIELISPNHPALHDDSPYAYLTTDIGQTQISLVKSFSYFCLFLCSLMLIDNEKRLKAMLVVLLASGVFQALYGMLEIMLGMKYSMIFNIPVASWTTGSFVYKNHYANFLMLCLSAGTGLLIVSLNDNQALSRRGWSRNLISSLLSNKALIRISLAIMVIALVMSRSRMGNAAFFVALTLVGIYTLIADKKRSQGLLILVVSMIVIDLFIVSSWFGLDKVQERLAQTSLTQESRDEVVIDSMPIVSDFPIVGTGGGSYYGVFPSYKKSNLYAFYDHTHNDYLEFLIEYGFISLFCLGVLVLMCFYSAAMAIKKRRNVIFKGAGFASLMAMTGMLIHMFVDFPLQAPANASYFIVFLALALISYRSESVKPNKSLN